MISPARPRTESRHLERLPSSFFTIMQRLSASGIKLPSVLEVIEEAGPGQCGLGLHGCLIAGLLLGQCDAGGSHIGVTQLAERGLVLELELLGYVRGARYPILNATVELELL